MKLFVREKGNPSLPTLLILHGLWGASDNWLPVAERLARQFHVIIPDMRNHGHSPHIDTHTYSEMANDICELINTLHLSAAPYIAGHSMGGKCLMNLMINHPGTVKKAAIIDIAPKIYKENEEHCQIMEFIKQFTFEEKENRLTLHKRIRNKIKNERICQILLKNIERRGNGFKWKINTHTISAYMPDILGWNPTDKKCDTPTLFISGESSDYLLTEDIQDIQTIFPHADFTTIKGTDHWIHAQQPDRLAEILEQFFLG